MRKIMRKNKERKIEDYRKEISALEKEEFFVKFMIIIILVGIAMTLVNLRDKFQLKKIEPKFKTRVKTIKIIKITQVIFSLFIELTIIKKQH